MNNKQTILLKISGEFLKGEKTIICPTKLKNIVSQIGQLSKKYNIGIVLGGGNIIRGGMTNIPNVARTSADQMGMLSTTINCLALRDSLTANGIKNKMFSLIPMPTIAHVYNINEAKRALNKGKVVIFTGGTGNPYFSTDTGIALRALENNAKTILMAKNGVDGVYSDDPRKNKKAKRLSKLTYNEIIQKNLMVMDITATQLLKDSDVEILVFNADETNCFIKAMNKKILFTKITK
ncbi:MAG: UMP kinase [Mycoplasma sp.]